MVGFTGNLASHLIIRQCPYCRSNGVRRSHRKNLGEAVLSFVGVYPFRCDDCYGRFRKLDGRLLAVISLVMKLMIATITAIEFIIITIIVAVVMYRSLFHFAG
jgi:hypothetical protein